MAVGVGDAWVACVTVAEALGAAVGGGVEVTDDGDGVGVAVKMPSCPGGFRPHHEYARMTHRAAPQMRARVDCLIGEPSP